jgi:hypothetical protein
VLSGEETKNLEPIEHMWQANVKQPGNEHQMNPSKGTNHVMETFIRGKSSKNACARFTEFQMQEAKGRVSH